MRGLLAEDRLLACLPIPWRDSGILTGETLVAFPSQLIADLRLSFPSQLRGSGGFPPPFRFIIPWWHLHMLLPLRS
jgi:hypothetical protein